MGRSILLVGIGGFLGSVLRYLTSIFFVSYVNIAFPLATLTVNVVGCFLIGAVFEIAERGHTISPEWRVLLMTGFCGGFTTFSAFSLESLKLMQDGSFFLAFTNVALSVLLCLLATWLGIVLIRSL